MQAPSLSFFAGKPPGGRTTLVRSAQVVQRLPDTTRGSNGRHIRRQVFRVELTMPDVTKVCHVVVVKRVPSDQYHCRCGKTPPIIPAPPSAQLRTSVSP